MRNVQIAVKEQNGEHVRFYYLMVKYVGAQNSCLCKDKAGDMLVLFARQDMNIGNANIVEVLFSILSIKKRVGSAGSGSFGGHFR